MAPLQQQFDLAVDLIQSLPKDGPVQQSDDVKLTLYGYYKQAKIGKINIDQPAIIDPIGRAKWGAWNKLGDMSKEEAMKLYVQEISKLFASSNLDAADDALKKKITDFQASLK